MSHRLGATLAVLLAMAAVPLMPELRGDLIRLKNGGELRGELREERGRSGERLTVRTLSGAVVSVDRVDIEFLSRRPLRVEEYEARSRRTPMTVEAQWELAEWCRQNTLISQRERHLEHVIELDPDHEQAHYALGHSLHDGEWMTRDELMTSRGYVKYKGRYVTPQELELLEKSAAELQAEREWYRKVRLWHGWLTRFPDRARDALVEFRRVRDPNAVAALQKYFAEETDRQMRGLYVEILEQIPGDKSAEALVRQSLLDADADLRTAALEALKPDQHERAMKLYIAELKNGLNPVVERAAAGLKQIGDDRAVPDLIEALVTTHRYRVTVPDPTNSYSFGGDGSFATAPAVLPPDVEMAMRLGQLPQGVIVNKPNLGPVRTRQVTVKKDHRNANVLAALRELTGEDFGYDERTWQLWYTAQKSGALGSIKS